jgi:FkbM family methyltransferase
MKRSIQIGERQVEVASDDGYLAAQGPSFEPRMAELFRALVPPGGVVADIGANIGLTAILFAQLAREVHAFEPSPTTFALLSENLRMAGAGNVVAHNIGLGEAPARLTLTYAPSNRSGGFVSRRIRPGGHVTEDIAIETADAAFAARGIRPDFLKIDVEGFEPFVLRGAARVLREARPAVVLELNHFCLNVLQRIALPDFLDQLRETFPVLIAVDADNRRMADLHDPDAAYGVMHAHVTQFRFPNLVGAFERDVAERLRALAEQAQGTA